MVLAALVALIPITLSFQNCSEGFRSATGGVDASSGAKAFPGVPAAAFKACYSVSANDSQALASCLNAGALHGAQFSAAAIDTCVAAGETTADLLAMCLTRNNQVVLDHRYPRQHDIDQCRASLGDRYIAYCLAQRGLRNAITQTDLDECLASSGASGVEACLRSAGKIPRLGPLFQHEAVACARITGDPLSVYNCLRNSQILPADVTQQAWDQCMLSDGLSAIVSCLRREFHVSRVVMQFHIRLCAEGVGNAAIADCLETQGLLLVPAAQKAAFQTQIDSCIASDTLAASAKCLRRNGVLSSYVMQPHINACAEAVGLNNTYACLNANFLLPVAFTQDELRLCFEANNNTTANAARCVANKRILPSVPLQVHVETCARIAGEVADTTGARPGQVGIATCLDRSGAKPAALTQADINTCIASNQLSGVALCLANNGIVPALSRLNANGGLFAQACNSCHSGNGAQGNLNLQDYASIRTRVVPGDALASVLFVRVNNNTMPPNGGVTQANKDILARWINQGANNN